MITPTSRFTRNDNMLSREIAGEVVVVPLRRGSQARTSIFTLNEVGAVVWDLIAATRPTSEIAQAVAERFEVSEAQALADVIEFLSELKKQGMITPLAED